MGNFKFSMHMLKQEYRKSMFYGITLIFSITVCFVFFNIIANPLLADQGAVVGGATWAQMEVPFSSTLSFIIVCFCCFMIFFANNFFLSRKTTEIAIMTLSGSSSIDTTLYLVYQMVVLMLIAAPIGLGIGQLVIPYCNAYMFELLNVHSSIYYIPLEAYVQALVLITMMLLMLCVLAGGYIYRNDIQTLLSQEVEMRVENKGMFRIPGFLYVLIYIGGLVMMFMQEHQSTGYIMPTAVGIFGAIGVIKFVIPDTIIKVKDKYLITKRYVLIAISNVSYSISRSVSLFSIVTASITGMVAILAANQNSPREFATAIIGYGVIVVLLITSIVYKFSMEAQTRKTLFFNLWKIGYTRKELARIVRTEVLFYYLVLLVIPFIYVLTIAGRFVYFGEMTMSFAVIILLIYLVPIFISTVITYLQYKNSVVKPIKGGK